MVATFCAMREAVKRESACQPSWFSLGVLCRLVCSSPRCAYCSGSSEVSRLTKGASCTSCNPLCCFQRCRESASSTSPWSSARGPLRTIHPWCRECLNHPHLGTGWFPTAVCTGIVKLAVMTPLLPRMYGDDRYCYVVSGSVMKLLQRANVCVKCFVITSSK